MEKKGFRKIGYIHNLDYPRLIREKAGITYYDYAEFDNRIDRLWDKRDAGIICYDKNKNEVSVNSNEIICFLMDTGFCKKDSSERIFASFPSVLQSLLHPRTLRR